jgi:hypothetical protein
MFLMRPVWVLSAVICLAVLLCGCETTRRLWASLSDFAVGFTRQQHTKSSLPITAPPQPMSDSRPIRKTHFNYQECVISRFVQLIPRLLNGQRSAGRCRSLSRGI